MTSTTTSTTTMPTTTAPAFNWTDAVVFKNPEQVCEDCERPDNQCDCETCWDCDEEVATHGHFCEDCNLEPLMCRSSLTKPGVCRLCADDDYKVEAIGSYGEDNIPMCVVCKEVGRFNSDGTKKSPGNDDDEEDFAQHTERLRKEVNVFCGVCDKVMKIDELKLHTHE